MTSNLFFKKKGPYPLSELSKHIGVPENELEINNTKINGLESLDKAKINDITFLNSIKYKDISLKTNASACITTQSLSKYLPEKCVILVVKDVLLSVNLTAKYFYPNADIDLPDENLQNSKNLQSKYLNVKFGENVLIGKNVKIGNHSYIGSNSIIESNVTIGGNCIIGSFVLIRNSLISSNVHLQDGVKIGIKGFGFIPLKDKNIRTPHIGKVILSEGVEIGANSTIDRGSVGNTCIGKNTYLDNQVHVAHNVRIGKNCMIAGHVGFAGSSVLGDNVIIGGQAGVSGHLKIGNNVKIGGGSGVINDLSDNARVMGYPAIPIRDFVKKRKKNDK